MTAEQPEVFTPIRPLSDRERLSYLEGWTAGAQYALEHPTDQTASLASTMDIERLALWRELFE